MTLSPALSVERIAREFPVTLKVLAKHRIDLCCGGRHSLEEVARKHGLDLPALLQELEEALRAGPVEAP